MNNLDFFKTIKSFMIVIENNEASEYYSEYCTPSWKNVGINVEKFKAVVPSDLNKLKELTFVNKNMTKYASMGVFPPHTPTEMACFYSHFKLWQECVYLNEPILILEHDSYLIDPSNLWFDNYYDIVFYDKGAMGAYVITPHYAQQLVNYTIMTNINCGPYGFIESFSDQVLKRSERIVMNNSLRRNFNLFKPACNQVKSEKFGFTIIHTFDTDEFKKQFPTNDFISSKMKRHQFIMIE